MARRAALATAGALTIVLLAAAVAAVNLGLLRVTGDTGQVGRLDSNDLVHPAVVHQDAPMDTTAPPGGGGAGTDNESRGGEPDSHGFHAGDLRVHDEHGVRGRAPAGEHFMGRQDDD
jgi:hypothetical protein